MDLEANAFYSEIICADQGFSEDEGSSDDDGNDDEQFECSKENRNKKITPEQCKMLESAMGGRIGFPKRKMKSNDTTKALLKEWERLTLEFWEIDPLLYGFCFCLVEQRTSKGIFCVASTSDKSGFPFILIDKNENEQIGSSAGMNSSSYAIGSIVGLIDKNENEQIVSSAGMNSSSYASGSTVGLIDKNKNEQMGSSAGMNSSTYASGSTVGLIEKNKSEEIGSSAGIDSTSNPSGFTSGLEHENKIEVIVPDLMYHILSGISEKIMCVRNEQALEHELINKKLDRILEQQESINKRLD